MSDRRLRSEQLVISFQDALTIVLNHIASLPSEVKALAAVHNSFLAEDIKAPFPVPRFDHSAVDGYAIKAEDVTQASEAKPVRLNVIGTVKTGEGAIDHVKSGCAIRLFTGAMLPPGANAVVMVEDTSLDDDTIRCYSSVAVDKNIRRIGEEFSQDAVCLPKATKLTPAAIGLAATLGLNQIRVYRKPRVSLIITGSELVEPGTSLGPAQIYDSNRFALRAALEELGIEQIQTHTCNDDQLELRLCIERALGESDVIITSGGASVGDVDYVKPAIVELGGTIHFDKVAIKPGKPTVFATIAGKSVFGLPGNPVSALVSYLLFVKPALLKMLGNICETNLLQIATLNGTIRKRTPRTEFVRAKSSSDMDGLHVTTCIGQESHMLGGLVTADTLIVFDGEPRTLADDTQVQFLPIRWS